MSEARLREYVVDLTKIEGAGDFPCPRCEVRISPDDESETVYSILKSKARNGHMEELIIQCNQCLCRIHLRGFLSLDSEER